MPLVSHTQQEVHLKIVYYGPGLGGKTTNLEHIHRHTRPENRGKLLSLMDDAERTLFFDLLPMELGQFRGFRVRLHLCTVPGQIARDEIRRRVLRHVDGIVFVVDSQVGRLEANVESIRNLETNLRLQGDEPERMPLVVQYNKRDLETALPVPALREALLVPDGVSEVLATATSGRGVFETMKRITLDCLKLVGDPACLPEGRSPSILPGRRASMFPGGRPPAIDSGDMAVVGVPRAPKVPRFGSTGGFDTNEE